MNDKKKFYIVATPIGNLKDISQRAINVLSSVDIILCEDTRVTERLLLHYKLGNKKVESYHTHSTLSKEESIINNITSGVVYALVSDAGTPTISDPGVKLINRLYDYFGDSIDIIPIPGASAIITALSSSGFSGNQFTFYGFLPHKKGRNKIFEEIFNSDKISIFYESPHRIMKTLKYIYDNYNSKDRVIMVARELTKIYEEKIRGDINYIYYYFNENKEKVKGEFVVLIDKK